MRRLLLTALLLLAACTGGGCAVIGPPERPPNIVLILADDLGPGDLGCYGQTRIRTPNLDALAATGLRFTSAYAASPVCASSRASLLTGLSTAHSPIRDNKEVQPEGQQPLPADSLTLAEALKARGYTTAIIGKWGLGPPGSTGDPLAQGFDHFYGYNCQRHAHNHCPPWLYSDHEKVELPGNRPLGQYTSGVIAPGQTYAPDLLVAEAQRFIETSRDRPFFLFFATPVPHLALQVPEDSLAEYRGAFDDPPYDGKRGYLAHPAPRAAYAAMVTRLDRDVGRLLDTLRRQGLDDNTLIIFTSDNGPTVAVGGADSAFFNSADGRRGLKMSLEEGGIRVPLLIRWPGGEKPAVIDEPVALYDLFTTVLDVADGVPFAERRAPAAPADGVTLLMAIPGLPGLPPRESPLYWEYPAAGASQAVRVGPYKGIRRNARKNPDAPIEFYDLANDPGETTPISIPPAIANRIEQVMHNRGPADLPEWNWPAPAR